MMWLGILVGCGVVNAPLPGSSEESVFEVP